MKKKLRNGIEAAAIKHEKEGGRDEGRVREEEMKSRKMIKSSSQAIGNERCCADSNPNSSSYVIYKQKLASLCPGLDWTGWMDGCAQEWMDG